MSVPVSPELRWRESVCNLYILTEQKMVTSLVSYVALHAEILVCLMCSATHCAWLSFHQKKTRPVAWRGTAATQDENYRSSGSAGIDGLACSF